MRALRLDFVKGRQVKVTNPNGRTSRTTTAFAVLVLYLAVYLPMGMLQHARAHVALAHHRYTAIAFETISALGGAPSLASRLRVWWYWPPWHLYPGDIWAPEEKLSAEGDKVETTVGWSAVWGKTAEDKLALPNLELLAERIVWRNGKAESGLSELTLVGTVTYEGFSRPEQRWDPARQEDVWAYVRLHSTLFHIYNHATVWYVFRAHVSRVADLRLEEDVARLLMPEILAGRGEANPWPTGTLPEMTSPAVLPQVMARFDAYAAQVRQKQPGVQSRKLLLDWVTHMNFEYVGVFFMSDSTPLVFLWWPLLYLPSLPVRYLLFGPQIAAPHWLVVPLAVIYPLLLLGLVWWLARRNFTPRLSLWWKWLFCLNLAVWVFCRTR